MEQQNIIYEFKIEDMSNYIMEQTGFEYEKIENVIETWIRITITHGFEEVMKAERMVTDFNILKVLEICNKLIAEEPDKYLVPVFPN